MKNKLLTLLVALIVTFSLSYVVMAKTQDADKTQKNEVVSQETATVEADDSDLSLDKDSLTLEPGETATIKGTLEDEDLDIDKVEWDIEGADILDIDIDKDNNTFEATIKIDNNADDGDECTITFTVTGSDDKTYEAECDITVEEDNGLDLSKESLTLEPGDDAIIKGTLDDEDLDIDKVEFDIDGDQVVDVDIDKDNNKFEATIKADDDAKDGDKCTITFTVTDSEDKVYEESVDVVINADDQDDEDVDDNDDNDNGNIDKNENSCPAAPAIANKILKENGIKNKNKETGVNYISQIAKQKGKGASFNGVSKKDKDAYADAVRDYLEDECDLDLDD